MTRSGFQIQVHNQKLIFIFLKQNIHCGHSKEMSRLIEHLKHMSMLTNENKVKQFLVSASFI